MGAIFLTLVVAVATKFVDRLGLFQSVQSLVLWVLDAFAGCLGGSLIFGLQLGWGVFELSTSGGNLLPPTGLTVAEVELHWRSSFLVLL